MKKGKPFSRIIIVNLVVVTTLMMTLYGMINYYREYNMYYRYLENELNLISMQLSHSLTYSLWDFNTKVTEKIIEGGMENKNVYGILVKTPSQVFGRMRDMNWEVIPTDKDIPVHDLLHKKARIIMKDDDLGELIVLISNRNTKVDLRKSIISIALCVLTLNMSLVIILFLVLKRKLIIPLKEIENYAINMSLSRDNDNGNMIADGLVEELDNLKHAIVKMVNEICSSEKQLEEIIEFLPVATFVIDNKGQVVTWNKSTEKMTGVKAKDMIGKGNYEYALPFYGERRPLLIDLVLLPTSEQEKFLQEHYISITREGALLAGESTAPNVKGEVRFLSGWAHPYYNAEGEVIGAIENICDTTDKKQGEALRIAKNAAETANLAKSMFLANMSHEIRTPLNAILGFSQILSNDQTLSPQQRDQLETINRSGEHLLALINDILEISKIEAGRLVLNPTDFDIVSMISDLERMFKVKAEAKQLELTTQIAQTVPYCVRGDESKLRQIYTNLLGNAIKFTQAGSISLWVSCVSSQNGGFRLISEVKDTGVGISEEEKGRLFKYFEQTTSGIRSGGGTGLGLAISRQYVIMMGGDITVESEIGKGCLFRFEIDLDKGDEKNVDARQTLKVKGIRSGKERNRILIVDDKEENRQVLKHMLNRVGFTTRETFDGLSAVTEFKSWNPDLVLMDMRMPVMDGFEATRTIRTVEKGVKTPVVAVTASTLDDERQKVMAAGVDAFIGKPFREQELFHVIGSLLTIDYIYADEESEGTLTEKTVSSLTPEAISALPPDILTGLRQAVETADLDGMLEWITRIETLDEKTAAILKAMARRYEYEVLLSILTGGE